jgi:hypothetical protein
MPESIKYLFKQLLDGLQVAERQHRAAYDDASDNSSWDVADREADVVSQIRKWRRTIDSLNAEIIDSGVFGTNTGKEETPALREDEHVQNNETQVQTEVDGNIDESEDIKVGKYIRSKLRELSLSGFEFSDRQVADMCDISWSRKKFSYNRILPFAKIAILDGSDVSEQAKDENGHARYWTKVFSFGKQNLLIISQWYAKDKESFDIWYDNLSVESSEQIAKVDVVEHIEPPTATYVNLTTDFTETKPTTLRLFGKQYAVNSWYELYVKVCEILLLHHPYTMAVIDRDVVINSDEQPHFSYIQSMIKNNRKRLPNGLWIETSINPDEVINLCHKFLGKCGIPPDELCFETIEIKEVSV